MARKSLKEVRNQFKKESNIFDLPVRYDDLTARQKKYVRDLYVKKQNGLCLYCNNPLSKTPVQDKYIDWSLFPEHFMKYPIHLQHNHITGMTEGAVHAYCNAVLWQYHGR